MRDAFGGGAEAREPLPRPRGARRARDLRQHLLVEVEPDAQLRSVLRDQQHFVARARLGDEKLRHVLGLHSMDRLKKLLQLQQRRHWTNPLRGTTPCRTSTVASRSLPVFMKRSYRRTAPAFG